MEDGRIVELYWQRDESAITETIAKYDGYLVHISRNILSSREDARECVNDTYIGAWNSMPPNRPDLLSAFLAKITRRISITRWRRRTAKKRGSGETEVVLHELGECVSGAGDVESEIERRELLLIIDRFIGELPETERRVFLRRYWYMDSITDIARRFGFSASKVSSMLFRTRGKLRAALEKEGY